MLVMSAAQQTPEPATIRRAGDVLSLSAVEAERRMPVELEGIVTAAEPDWGGRFFIQDASAGIFVDFAGVAPIVGDVLRVKGRTDPGAFAPIVSRPQWGKIGTGPLPEPTFVAAEELLAGVHDSHRVRISGIVRAVHLRENRFVVDLASGGFRIPVITQVPGLIDTQSLIGCRVTVAGTAAASYHPQLRHITGMKIIVPVPADFVLNTKRAEDGFSASVVPIRQVASYRRNAGPANRVRVKGQVVYNREGQIVVVDDGTGALHVRGQHLDQLALGETVDLLGFLDFENHLPFLNDVLVRRSREPQMPPRVLEVPARELFDGLHPSELVRLRGTVLNAIPHRAGDISTITWTLQNADLTFTAELASKSEPLLTELLPVGSFAEVIGIISSPTGDDGRVKQVHLLVPRRSSVAILKDPSWFTPRRLLITLLLVGVSGLAVSVWTITLTKKNAGLKLAVMERERAKEDLRQAHDQLEHRVQERTEQLKVEMTARKAAELQFKAVLSERTRLAQELHDTLEQTLIGVSLQLDAATKQWDRGATDARQHLEVAQNWIRQSQIDLRRSIWDLRTRAMDEFDLAQELARNGQQIAGAAGIEVEMQTEGTSFRLPEVVEENILRIGQEALTNVVKHSAAKHVLISLSYSSGSVALEVRDNGKGLGDVARRGPEENHFGLLGMSERVKRLGGHLDVLSPSGEGVTVRVKVSLEKFGPA